jgi:hypothetical protein
MGIKKQTQKLPMDTIFASQLQSDSFVRTVSFIVVEEDGRETVHSQGKTKIDDISTLFEFVEVEKNRLPRFIRK